MVDEVRLRFRIEEGVELGVVTTSSAPSVGWQGMVSSHSLNSNLIRNFFEGNTDCPEGKTFTIVKKDIALFSCFGEKLVQSSEGLCQHIASMSIVSDLIVFWSIKYILQSGQVDMKHQFP